MFLFGDIVYTNKLNWSNGYFNNYRVQKPKNIFYRAFKSTRIEQYKTKKLYGPKFVRLHHQTS